MQDHVINGIVGVILFSVIGMAVFGLAFFVIAKVTPFSLRKEIEEDQNTALGVLIGSIMIGLSIIIAAAIHS